MDGRIVSMDIEDIDRTIRKVSEKKYSGPPDFGIQQLGDSTAGVSVFLPHIMICFSYDTPIAFRHNADAYYVNENLWGPTTGKHIKAAKEMLRDTAQGVSAEELWDKLRAVV